MRRANLLAQLVYVALDHLVRGVVKEDVDAAHLLERLVDDLLAVVPARQVGGEKVALAAVRLHDALRLLRVLLLVGEVDDEGVGAFQGEQDGGGPADARVAARDDGLLALQLAGGLVLLVPAVVSGQRVVLGLYGQLALLPREVLVGYGDGVSFIVICQR